jgi:hypothetical protein
MLPNRKNRCYYYHYYYYHHHHHHHYMRTCLKSATTRYACRVKWQCKHSFVISSLFCGIHKYIVTIITDLIMTILMALFINTKIWILLYFNGTCVLCNTFTLIICWQFLYPKISSNQNVWNVFQIHKYCQKYTQFVLTHVNSLLKTRLTAWMLSLRTASVMLICLSWTNVIISGDTFFNTINKTRTSVMDGTYPTFGLFTLVRYGVIIIPLSNIIVIILSFPFPLLQYSWGI